MGDAGITIYNIREHKSESSSDRSRYLWHRSWRTPPGKGPWYPIDDLQKGQLRHSSNWEPNFDPTGKRIAVIGNGASGIPVVPEVQKVASYLDHYARSRTWIAESLGGRDGQIGLMLFSKDQLKEFEDPDVYLAYRKAVELTYWRRFGDILKDSESNSKAGEQFKELMGIRLADKPELLDEIILDFSPLRRRLTPGPGHLEALTKENAGFIQTTIKRFTETGIETEDDVHREVDAIICSTGAKVDFVPLSLFIWQPKPGKGMDTNWTLGFPHSYLGIATPGFLI